jgi:hypothetical protein
LKTPNLNTKQQNALGAKRKMSMTKGIPAEKKVVVCVFQFSVKPEITHEAGPYKSNQKTQRCLDLEPIVSINSPYMNIDDRNSHQLIQPLEIRDLSPLFRYKKLEDIN